VQDGTPEPALVLEDGVSIGCGSAADVHIEGAGVGEIHARVHVSDDTYFIEDVSNGSTFLNNERIAKNKKVQLHPGDFVAFGEDAGVKGTLKVKLLHSSQASEGLLSWNEDGTTTRTPVTTKAS
jgi:predicted component of type VI protein secretion system